MNTPENNFNIFLFRLVKIVAFVSVAYLANRFVTELFGGVNPFLEFSSMSFFEIESSNLENDRDLSVAYSLCKDNLNQNNSGYQFADESYKAWYLSKGRFLIQTKVYGRADSGSPVTGRMMCKILKKEDDKVLATNWEVQGVQVETL